MKKLAYGVLSSLMILVATVPVGAETPTSNVAQSNLTIEQMFRQQQVFANEMQTMMAQMQTMMAQMKALDSLPEGQTPTMADLYKQQQMLIAQIETLSSRTKIDTILPRRSPSTVQEVHQQQTEMMTEMKSMMAEMRKMQEVYRGRASGYKR